jgi:plasmid stabilization system protein ParE
VTFEVRIRPEAEQDMTEAASWYEQQQRGLGQDFLDEALAVFMRLAETPLGYGLVHRSGRRALLRRFPFAVFYSFEEGVVLVVSVLHGSRHPRHWMRRA